VRLTTWIFAIFFSLLAPNVAGRPDFVTLRFPV